MSSTTTRVGLDLTFQGLFPKIEAAATDPKCVIISQIMHQIIKHCGEEEFTQSTLQDAAIARYSYLSAEIRLSLPEANFRARTLCTLGVGPETANEFYSFRLSEADAKKWSVVMIKPAVLETQNRANGSSTCTR